MNNHQKKENPIYNIIFNIGLPVLILMKLSKENYLGPTYALIVALAFPIGYGIYEYIKTKKVNTMSIFGLVSVFLSGGFVLLKLPAEWVILQEVAKPLIIGIVFLVSNFTKKPLVNRMLLDSGIFDKEKLHTELDLRQNREAFYGKIKIVSYLMVFTFGLSAVLNYILGKMILISEPGTTAYNEEFGKMTGLSFPVIAVPSMLVMGFILWYLFKSIKNLSGLSMEDVMVKS